MAFKFFDSNPPRVPYRETVINPATGQEIDTGPVYNVMQEANILSESDVEGSLPADTDAAQSSVFILDAFGFTPVDGYNQENFTLASGIDLKQHTLEKFEKTSDVNPNRDEKDKFSSLKTGKVSADKIFDQKTNNPANELDQNRAAANTKQPKVSQDLIGLTDDFLKYSPLQLVNRIKK